MSLLSVGSKSVDEYNSAKSVSLKMFRIYLKEDIIYSAQFVTLGFFNYEKRHSIGFKSFQATDTFNIEANLFFCFVLNRPFILMSIIH